MKKSLKVYLSTFVIAALMLGIGLYVKQKQAVQSQPISKIESSTKPSKQQRIEAALEQERERTKDLKSGYPSVQRRFKAMQEATAMQEEQLTSKSGVERIRFRERGPNNIGGRTRTILIDKNDPSGNTIWVGSVSGGLWKSDNVRAANPSWIKMTRELDNLAVGAMAQDPNSPNLMYLGTGEGFPNGDSVNGIGIFRSTDGGNTWELLPFTTDGRFDLTRTMLVHPDNGDVYAGTSRGLYRSQDQGESWELVLTGGIYDIVYAVTSNTLFTSNRTDIYTSITGDNRQWTNITLSSSGFPNGFNRVEFDVSQQSPNIMVAVASIGGAGSDVYRTTNGGETWLSMGPVTQGDFTNGQAWYDLEIVINPFNPNHVVVGGVPFFQSFDGGNNFQVVNTGVHVDHHKYVFDPERPGVIYLGNDGGIYLSDDRLQSTRNRNLGYNVTQFYAGALHPDTLSNYMLGGTQDNNSLQMDDFGIAPARSVRGGDGVFCHIDQNEPEFQLVSSQFGAYGLSTNGGKSFSGGANVNGAFLNPSDYDNDANIMYAQTFNADLARWKIPFGEVEYIDIRNASFGAGDTRVTAVTADPTTPNRLYLGSSGGEILMIDNADKGDPIEATKISTPSGGSVSCIEIDQENPQHLLVTYFNYGLNNNIFESRDGGATWIGVEGNLPDMPVRWALFNPDNSAQALIATEAGVWSTEQLMGSSTEWIPPAKDIGIPLVRTDMLQIRSSDKMVLAATHGRGMFTTDVFSDPRVVLSVDRIGYLDAPIFFEGTLSLGVTDVLWEFGDGNSTTEQDAFYSYGEIGEYDVKLTINDELSESASIKILPDRTLPYVQGEAGYSGGFESRPEDYGVYTTSGSAFELASSNIRGKDGTFDGNLAYVLAPNEPFYAPNTESMIYLPNFDFSDEGIYEFSFWSKYFVQDGFDGFLVEYTTDKGQNWRTLGTEQENWYDFTNSNNLEGAAFQTGTSYFARSRSRFTQFYLDISFLSGQEDVAFRFRFRSNDTGNHPGVVIDNVEISKFDGALQTEIVSIEGDYSSGDEITVSWVTQPEYNATRFVLEQSFNGRDFEAVRSVDKILATGGTTARVQNYDTPTLGNRDLYFFRVRSFNENAAENYFFEFVSPIVTVRRGFEDVEVYRTFPNPFIDYIDLTFTDVVNEPVKFDLYDAVGRLIFTNEQQINAVYTRVETGKLPAGVYFLSYQIGDREAETIRLLAAE